MSRNGRDGDVQIGRRADRAGYAPERKSEREEGKATIHLVHGSGWRIRHINTSGLGARTWTGRDPRRLS